MTLTEWFILLAPWQKVVLIMWIGFCISTIGTTRNHK